MELGANIAGKAEEDKHSEYLNLTPLPLCNQLASNHSNRTNAQATHGGVFTSHVVALCLPVTTQFNKVEAAVSSADISKLLRLYAMTQNLRRTLCAVLDLNR
jgi:hypothetical protein